MNEKLNFDHAAWLKALRISFTEAVNQAIEDFEEGLLQDAMFDKEKVKAGMYTIKRKMLASINLNIDRLETFYMQNTHMYIEGPNYDLISRIEHRVTGDKNYQDKVDGIFKEMQSTCDEFSNKKQQYLKYCLYDKYLEKERKFASNEAENKEETEIGYFHIKTQEDRIYVKAKQDKEFLKDFKNYVELFENMQVDLLKKLN